MEPSDYLRVIRNEPIKTVSVQSDLKKMYAIVDTAREEAIYGKLVHSRIEGACLYRGQEATELADVAPYLVKLNKDDAFTDWLFENCWGNSWGIFLESSLELPELKRHFRKFIMIYDEEGKSLYFRFYDPRVLRVMMPIFDDDQVKQFFGPVERYLVETEEEDELVIYMLKNDQG